MRDNLLTLLKCHPLTKGCTPGFLDDLAENIMAVVIRATVSEGVDGVEFIDDLKHRTNDIYNDHFGVKLSNLFTTEYCPPLSFDERSRVVKAMIETMLMEELAIVTFNEFNPDGDGRAELLKRRLQELTDGDGRAELLKRRLQELSCTTTIN